jgi:CRISPR system Cascade subunit CasA
MSAGCKVAINLIDEKWIPVRTLDGERRLVSLRDALVRARAYAGLSEELTPPGLIGLYRLLLAALNRALTLSLGDWTVRQQAEWFQQGVPQKLIEPYLSQWYDRFWLFHPEHPFLQVPVLEQIQDTRDKQKPWTQLSLDRASGNNPTLFDHSVDDAPEPASWQEVLWSLIGFLQFTPGGLVRVLKRSDKGGPLANSAAVLPLGDNLVQTLLLALHRSRSEDMPSWERNPPTEAELRDERGRLATGPNDRYSWLSRAVLLIEEEDAPGRIRWIRFGAGMALADDPQNLDAMVAYRIGPEGHKPIRLEEGRAFWRDLPSLVPDPQNSSVHPPAVLSWARQLCLELGQFDRDVPVLVLGVTSEQAKPARLLRWRTELVRLPAKLLKELEAARFVRSWVGLCEELFNDLRKSLARVHKLVAEPHTTDKRRDRGAAQGTGSASTSRQDTFRADVAAAVYFQRAEWALPELLSDAVNNRTAANWRRELRRAAREAWDAGIRHLGPSPAVWIAEARERGRFFAQCRRKLGPDAEE